MPNNKSKPGLEVAEKTSLALKVTLILGMTSAFLVGVALVSSFLPYIKETEKAAPQTKEGVKLSGTKLEEDDFSQTEILIKFSSDIIEQTDKEQRIKNIVDKALAEPLPVLPTKIQTTPPSVNQDIPEQTVKAEFKNIGKAFPIKQDINQIKDEFPQRTKRIPKNASVTPNLNSWYKLELKESIEKGAVKSLIEILIQDENIEYVEPNMRLQAMQVPTNLPSDPYYYSSNTWSYGYPNILDLWGFYNIGLTPTTGEQPSNSGTSGWDYERGDENIIIAVIDTGLDYNHEDIIGNVWQNNDEIADNNIDDDGNGYIDDTRGWNFSYNNNDPLDDYGHGTHVSGTAAAVTNNEIGVAGVCWYCKIMAIKGLDNFGYGSEDSLAEAIHYAADNGADVINMSWGGYGYSQLLSDAIDYAHGLGVVLVAAAGNSYDNAINYTPAHHDKVITVAASNYFDDEKANFSNYGDKIDATAPGMDIFSIKPQHINFGVPFGDYKYATADGTSMAAPHVSGLAALLISHFPEWSNDLIKGQIMSTTDDISDSIAGILKHGKINVYKALTMTPQPHILFYNQLIDDSSGNNDGKIDPGETVNVNVTLKNYGYQATNVYATLSTKDSCVTVGSPFFPYISTFGDLATNSTASNRSPYVVTLEPDCSFRNITFYLDISADNSYSQKDEFQVIYPYTISYQGSPISTDVYSGEATPLLVNLDNDTDLEIVVGTKDKVYAFNYDGSLITGWPISVQGFVTSTKPVYGNFDNDAYPEIIFTTFTWYNYNPAENQLHIVNHDGTYVHGWPIPTDKEVREAPAVADINQDGYDEIIFSSVNVGEPRGNKIYVIDRNGNNISGWPFTFGNSYPGAQATVADLNKDGNLEIIFGGWEKLYVWNNQGQPYMSCWPLELTPRSRFGPAVVADIDQDKQLEIIVGTEVFNDELVRYETKLFAINDNCTLVEGWPVNFGFHKNVDFTPVAGDIDNDGDLEILDVTHEYNKIYAFHHDGSRVEGWPIIADFVRKISLADLDNDDTLEVLAGTCYSPWGGCWGGENYRYDLQAWHFDGKPVAGFPIMWINNQGQTQPVIADLDRDSDLELISAARAQYNGDINNIYIFDLPHRGNLEWLMYQADLRNTGLYNQTNQCLDSTPFGQCSSTAPRYCDNGVLYLSCSDCSSKCPTNYPYCNEQKGLCEAKCSDGTPFNQCSTHKPQYCDSQGNITDKCLICGCPSGQVCKKMRGYPAGKCIINEEEPIPALR